MKTKTLFLLCLLLAIGSAQLSAQNRQNGTGTDAGNFEVTWVSIIPVFCEGQLLDEISTPPEGFICKFKDHYKEGEFIWEISMANNIEFTSLQTGEVFIGRAFKDKFLLEEGRDYSQINLKGNMGSHYIIHMVFDIFNNWEIIEVHANCH